MTGRSVSYTLVDVDGNKWPAVGVAQCSLETPMRFGDTPGGLNGAPFDHQDGKNVDQAGVSWQGSSYDPNTITLRKVRFGPVPPGEDALDRWLEFIEGFGDGRQLGEFHTHSRRRGKKRDRFQIWRLASELPDVAHNVLVDGGYVDVGNIALRSDESWWRQRPIDLSFPPSAFSGAAVPNACDEDVWAYWEVLGPITNATIGLAGESIVIPGTIAAGQRWTINTDPNDYFVRNHLGIDRSSLKLYWRTKAPRRTAAELGNGTTDVPVTLFGTGTSAATRVRLVLPQLYRSAL